ncbi:multiple rna-binding domain-containing protein 1 [Brettanomyces bruxellensis AWRI1499]|nr:multiple rna-binding domain-containing protein 1 [Brettanomyces bruxellensis AWRI1499]
MDQVRKEKDLQKSTKIIVKNLPFEASRDDVFQLFSSFAHLKSVRVPKKFDRSARGFAFVEFNTVKEAETVMDQLQGVHLLGRRLVLDFAEKNADNAEEEISRMTKKARKQVNATKLAGLREMNEGKRELDLESDGE